MSSREYRGYIKAYTGLVGVGLLISAALLFSVPCVLRVPNVSPAQRWRGFVIGGLVCFILASMLDIATCAIFLVATPDYDYEYYLNLFAAQQYMWIISSLMIHLVYMFVFLSLASSIIEIFSRSRDGRILGTINLAVYGLASVLVVLGISRFGLEIASMRQLLGGVDLFTNGDLRKHRSLIDSAICIAWWIISLGVVAGALSAYFTRKHLRGNTIITCSILWLAATTYQFASTIMFRFLDEVSPMYILITGAIFINGMLCATLAFFTYLGSKRSGFWDYKE